MVDITEKPAVKRRAEATGFIRLRPETVERIRKGTVEKGDPLSMAKLAAIMAAKQTHLLIPLTHPIPITGVDVSTELLSDGVRVSVSVRTAYKTGCEVDALTAAAVALLTIFDCVKQYEKDERGRYPVARIEELRVVEKEKGEEPC